MNKQEYIEKFERDVRKRSRIMRLLLVIDQTFNVLLWNGSQDETVSSHIGRKIELGDANALDILVCKILRMFQAKHCIKSKGE